MRLAVALLLLKQLAHATHAGGGTKPHILMVVVDDLGWHNVGWHNPDMITPNSDALVAEGVELDRHYVYMYCSPTRSSFHSGRFPYHVNQIILSNDGAVPDWGVPKEMTLLPLKLKAAGYATHAAGKWHIGFQSEALLPTSRGYDSYLGYLQGSMDHWTQAEDAAYLPAGIAPMQPYGEFPGLPNVWMKAAGWNHSNVIDWWWNADGMLPGGGGPAVGLNGSLFHLGANGQVVGDEDAYTDRQTTDQAILNVRRHNSTQPMFQYVAFQNCHAPLEAPDRHIEMYPKEWREDRRWYAGMVTYWDEAVGNITAAYKAAGMWDRTLMVLTTDNGGPTYWAGGAWQTWPPLVPGDAGPGYPHGGGANNFPLKGSKASNWEGGTRGAAFMSGGFVPLKMRGKKLEDYVHITDWFASFCFLAGVDPADSHTVGHRNFDGAAFPLPPIDSVNVWGYVSGQEAVSPRQELPLSVGSPRSTSGALIIGNYKILIGQMRLSYWQGADFPNKTNPTPPWGVNQPYGTPNSVPPVLPYDCGVESNLTGGCLFDIKADPTEQHNLASAKPQLLKQLKDRYAQLRATQLDQSYVEYFAVACGYGPKQGEGNNGPAAWSGSPFIDGDDIPTTVELEGWPTLHTPAAGASAPPPPPLPPAVAAICDRWSSQFIAMLKRNRGHLGPYLDE